LLPLSEKARIEAYLPDLAHPSYPELLAALEREFTYAFGGCTLVRGLEGSYLSRRGIVMRDRIDLLYSDTPFSLTSHLPVLSHYVDELRDAAFQALDEEAILIAVFPVHHGE
jgi:hypothetical protein